MAPPEATSTIFDHASEQVVMFNKRILILQKSTADSGMFLLKKKNAIPRMRQAKRGLLCFVPRVAITFFLFAPHSLSRNGLHVFHGNLKLV